MLFDGLRASIAAMAGSGAFARVAQPSLALALLAFLPTSIADQITRYGLLLTLAFIVVALVV